MVRFNSKLWCLLTLTAALYCIPLFAQGSDSTVQGRSWSICATGLYNFPASSSMRGTNEEFRADVMRDYNNRKYPFASPTYAFGWSGKILYALPSSGHTDLFLGFSGNFINSEQDNNHDQAFMAVWGVNLGVEYSLLPRWNTWNVFGRASISTQFIHGFTDYDFGLGVFRTNVPTAGRLGAEAELGGRFVIPSTPVALELSGGYLNANLLGKSYTKPPAVPNDDLYERQLNDGKNPDNPDDNSRTIDFLSIRLGARIWF